MSTIEERTAAREAALTEQLQQQRRQARPQEYLYCKSHEVFIDTLDNTMHSEKAVDASIPLEFWRVEVEEVEPEPEGQPRGRGRPRRPRERLIRPSRDIMRVETNQFVEGMTWAPGYGQVIKDVFATEGGLIPSPGRRFFNTYRPPLPLEGDKDAAWPWVDHIKKLWPNAAEHDHFFDYCAHMQRSPEIKCNSGIVLSGEQGIGKDAALYPLRYIVGPQNARNIKPDQLFEGFNPWIETVMLTIDEVRPTKDDHQASALYNILKSLTAAPPEMLPLNQKNMHMRYIVNIMRVFITTNHYLSLYIPPDDRRLHIMHSNLPGKWHEIEGKISYFVELFNWLESGGVAHVAAWLSSRDLTKFDCKKQVEKTTGWHVIAGSWEANDDALAAAIERLGTPDILFGAELLMGEFDGRQEIFDLLKSSRKMSHRMQQAGYVAVKPINGGQRWKFVKGDKMLNSRVAFVRSTLVDDPKLDSIVENAGREAVNKMAQNNIYSLKKDDF